MKIYFFSSRSIVYASLLLLLFSLAVSSAYAQEIVWNTNTTSLTITTTEVVSTESTAISYVPSLGVGSDGAVHIAWEDLTGYGGSGTDRDIFYKRYVPGTGWTTTEVVSTESIYSSLVPSLGVGPDGTVHIAWHDYTDINVYDAEIVYKRYVPGTGWTTTEVVSTESTDNSYHPSLGVGPDGTVHIAWIDGTDYAGAGTDTDIFYKRYVPGTGWTTTEVVSTESTNNGWSPSLGVGSDGAVHIAWVDYTGYGGSYTDGNVFYKRYVPGTGWTTTEVVSTESTSSSLGPSLGVGSDGAVHIAWVDYTDYEGSLIDGNVFYKRYVPGYGWTTTELVSTESTVNPFVPSLGVGSDGAVHITWIDGTDYGSSGTDTDIFYKRYVPGTGWTTTEVVSTESTSSSSVPSLGVGSDGAVHIAWVDYTDYEGSGTDGDIFYKKMTIAAQFQLVSTDETGRQKDVFDMPETVYIRGSGYLPTTIYDLYLVEDTTWSDGMDIPDRVSGTETSVTTDENGDIHAGTVAWNGQLTPGKYDIVVDVNGNKKYDEGIDAIDDDEIEVTAGFFVIPELPLGTVTALLATLAALILFKKRSVIDR